MAKIAGKAGEVTVAGSSVTGINTWSIDYNAATEDVTDFSDSGVDAHIPTTTGWTGSFEGFKDGAPLAIGTEIALVLKESQTTTQKWTGQAILTNVGANTSAKGVVTYKYSFIGTGVLTIPTA